MPTPGNGEYVMVPYDMLARQEFIFTRMLRDLNGLPQPRAEAVDDVMDGLLELRQDWRAVLSLTARRSIRERNAANA